MQRMDVIVSAFALSLAVAACASPPSTVPAPSEASPGWREPAGTAATSTNERIVYVFKGNGRGSHPFGTLTSDGHGAFYGTTVDGGAVCGQFVCGTIVKLTPRHGRYAETVLYRFRNAGDGYSANAGLIVDATGSIYGTSPCCYYGQVGDGVLFKLSPAKGHYRFTTLFAFSGLGPFPNGGLIVDNTGTFFGTAYQGGSSPADGAVFALAPSGSGYVESTIYSFKGGSDGANPAAGLTASKSGTLFGTTAFGGATTGSCQSSGCGVVFELTPAGSSYTESVLYRFQGGSDGNEAFASLVSDARGDLFGTTQYGGGAPSCPDGCGTVFELHRSKKAYSERVLYNFSGTGDYPTDPVLLGRAGTLYGSTPTGGSANNGTVFKLTPSSGHYVESDLHLFHGPPNDGETPNALTAGPNGSLVGTTYYGGSGPCGNDLGCGAAFLLRGADPRW
jgi:uncharacterized repeat protein (TIGR03803 family)